MGWCYGLQGGTIRFGGLFSDSIGKTCSPASRTLLCSPRPWVVWEMGLSVGDAQKEKVRSFDSHLSLCLRAVCCPCFCTPPPPNSPRARTGLPRKRWGRGRVIASPRPRRSRPRAAGKQSPFQVFRWGRLAGAASAVAADLFRARFERPAPPQLAPPESFGVYGPSVGEHLNEMVSWRLLAQV